MMNKKRVIRKTILNWKFHLVAPILVAFLAFKLLVKSLRILSKLVDRNLRTVEQWVDYNPTLKKLASWF